MLRAEPLQIVIQMREINQRQRRSMLLFDPLRGFCDPARDGIRAPLRCIDTRRRPPKAGKWKFTQNFLDLRYSTYLLVTEGTRLASLILGSYQKRCDLSSRKDILRVVSDLTLEQLTQPRSQDPPHKP